MTAAHIEDPDDRNAYLTSVYQDTLELAPAAQLLGVTRVACPTPDGNLLAVVLVFQPDGSDVLFRQTVVCRPEDGPVLGVCTDTQADWVKFYQPPTAQEATP